MGNSPKDDRAMPSKRWLKSGHLLFWCSWVDLLIWVVITADEQSITPSRNFELVNRKSIRCKLSGIQMNPKKASFLPTPVTIIIQVHRLPASRTYACLLVFSTIFCSSNYISGCVCCFFFSAPAASINWDFMKCHGAMEWDERNFFSAPRPLGGLISVII